MAGVYSKLLDKVEKIIMVIIGIMLMIMTASIFYQVVLRYIFHIPNVWAEELTRYLFAWISFLGSAVAIRRSSHLKVEFFIDLLKPRAKAMAHTVIYLAVLVFLFYLLIYGSILVSNTTVNLSAGMRIPMAIPYSSIIVGTVLMILFSIEMIARNISFLKS